MSDREIDQLLVERVQRGDKQAFGLLVSKYQRKLGRLLSRLIRDPAEVEDVAQETFIKAYRALPSFRGDSAFYTWLYRIGINTAKNYLVSQGRRAPTSTDFDSEEAETFEEGDQLRDINTPERLLMTKQIGDTVNVAMEALPEELRTAIVLREIEGLSYEEIASIMECPIGTVRSRIFRAREAISEKLKPLLDTAPNKGGKRMKRKFLPCLMARSTRRPLSDAGLPQAGRRLEAGMGALQSYRRCAAGRANPVG
jgi:RNA polymerase sigma-70 factor (ECF subfamily)